MSPSDTLPPLESPFTDESARQIAEALVVTVVFKEKTETLQSAMNLLSELATERKKKYIQTVLKSELQERPPFWSDFEWDSLIARIRQLKSNYEDELRKLLRRRQLEWPDSEQSSELEDEILKDPRLRKHVNQVIERIEQITGIT